MTTTSPSESEWQTVPATRAPGIWGSILLGALLYAVVLILALLRTETPYIGGFVYNYYALSLLEGRLDVPLQIIGFEGHYTADGRAFVYHGIGPVLTRLLALPFVTLTETDLAGVTIWLFATIGSASFYATARRITGEQMPRWGRRVLWGLVWVTGPGMVLVSNGSFYHEPIGLGFACLGLFLLLLWRLWEKNFRSGGLLILMAAVAALAVHARPHVALGLYMAVAAAALIFLVRRRLGAVPVLGVAGAILLLSGLAYMHLNAIRFGSPVTVDGSTVPNGYAVYGFLFWGLEPANSVRFVTSAEEGRFHPARIPSNLFSYFLALSLTSAETGQAVLLGARHVRLEWPMVPLVLIWPLWVVLALRGLAAQRFTRPLVWIMLLATVPAACLILSYPTVTMRYRMELWPMLFVLGASGSAALLRSGVNTRMRRYAFLLSAVGCAWAGIAAYAYSHTMNWSWGQGLYSYNDCARAVSSHNSLGPDRVADLCTENLHTAVISNR